MKNKGRRPNSTHYNGSGIFISVNPDSGWINGIYIAAKDECESVIVEGAFARIIKPSYWGWLRRLIGYKNK